MAIDQTIHRSVKDRRLYSWAAVVLVLIVLTGFARTYYLKGVFGAPALSGLVHTHGIVMTLWVALFVAQSWLVAARRTDLHRRLGVLGGALAGLVLVVGVVTAIVAARHGVSPGPPPLVFLVIPLGDIMLFAILVGTGLFFRRRRDIHKRLMLLSCGGIMAAAIARIPLGFIETGGPLVFFGLTDLFLLACIAFDTVKNRRLHPAFGWGILLVVVSQVSRLMISETQAWLQFASWLVG